jgi:hypothetical protein
MITVLIVAGIMAVTVAVAMLFMKRADARAQAAADELRDEVAARGEEWIVPLRGAGGLGVTPGRGTAHGVLGLTGRRLVFQPITGARVNVPVLNLTGARLESRRREALTEHRYHLALTLADGSVREFVVDDPAVWADGLASAGVPVAEDKAT